MSTTCEQHQRPWPWQPCVTCGAPPTPEQRRCQFCRQTVAECDRNNCTPDEKEQP